MANANSLGGFFPKKLSNNNFIGVVKLKGGEEEIAFDDDNVNLLLYKGNNGEAILELKGFTGHKAFLNGHIFEARKRALTIINYDEES